MAPRDVHTLMSSSSLPVLPVKEMLAKQAAGVQGNPLGDTLATLPGVELTTEAPVAEPQGPLANAVEVSKLLDAGVLKDVPPAFVFPKGMQATAPHEESLDDQDIPIIDLSPVFKNDPVGLETLIEDIARACETKGFFHIVGHGVPEQVIKDTQAHATTLFNLPLDQKLHGSFAVGTTTQRRGYSATPKTVSPSPALIWQESFTLIGGKSGEVDVASYAEKLWPDDVQQRESFRQVVIKPLVVCRGLLSHFLLP